MYRYMKVYACTYTWFFLLLINMHIFFADKQQLVVRTGGRATGGKSGCLWLQALYSIPAMTSV